MDTAIYMTTNKIIVYVALYSTNAFHIERFLDIVDNTIRSRTNLECHANAVTFAKCTV